MYDINKLNQEVEGIVREYRESSASKLGEIFNVNMTAKNAYSLLVNEILTHGAGCELGELISKENLAFKAIRLDKYGRLKEAMSLPAFKYCELVEETWDGSQLKKYFSNRVFAFAVFQAIGRELYLNKITIWNMEEEILEVEVRQVWQKMRNLLTEGKIVKYIDDNGRYFTYFPSSTENRYVHVRPHARNRQDTFPLPVADKLTGLVEYPKHSFWLNRSYVQKIINMNTGAH